MSVTNMNRNTMPSVLDREIRESESDAFGHTHFAEALKSLLEADSNNPPFSVGLLGSWGTGKSTIKELYLASVRNDCEKISGRTRSDRFRAVTFNAWRYGGEDIKRALLRHVFLALGGDEAVLRRELYQQVQQSTSASKGWWQWTKEAVVQNVASAALFVVLLGAVLLITMVVAKGVDLTNQVGLSALTTAALVIAAFLAKYVVDIRIKSPTFFTPTTTVQFPSTSAEEYELLLVQQLREFKQGREGRFCERLIIFVDDLDRLSAAEMVSGLDAVRTFLELPGETLPQGLGVIFVISCDEDRVAEALARGRGRLGSSDLPGSVFSRHDARRYLDRLFQFRLEIPRFPKRDMRSFALGKLQEMPSLRDALIAKEIRPDDVVEHLIHVGVQSPRNAVQLLNAFAQTWWIASQRERDGIGSDQPGMLHDKAVTDHPLCLAAICVLRVDFPDFFGRLQDRPQLIDEFGSVVFGTTDPSSLPSPAREALSYFLQVDKDGQLQREVQKEHRRLRQYLASLRGLRLPKRLQPLLLLAEDAVTRRYGPRAAELHEAFVSGDTQGVLEVFGRHLDNSNLAVADVHLLEDLSEAVAQDSELRRINAARVLADLADRIPEDHARSIMTPLARQLIDLKPVRMSVGPKLASSIRKHCGRNDQRDMAAQYCEDLLRDQAIEFLLPTGESPNLQELTQIVVEACELALTVRGEHGLPKTAESILIEWLVSRHIRLGSESTTLPFTALDRWVTQYEDALLGTLGQRYSDLAIAELETESADPEELTDVLRRICLIHDGLAEDGEESREVLWTQLTRLVAVRNAGAAEAAWDTAARHADLRMPPQGEFLAAMAGRLQKDLAGDESWTLDREAGAEQLLNLCNQWTSQLGESVVNDVSELLAAWAGVKETARYAERCFRILETEHGVTASSLLDSWSNTPLGSEVVGWPVRELIAKKMAQLTDAQRGNVVKQLDAVINPDQVPEEAAREYVRFVAAVPEQAWGAKPLRSHIDRLFARVEAMFQDQNGYLTQLYPAAVALLTCGPDGRAATLLQNVFEQAAGAPPAYVLLHGLMRGHWPKPDKKTGQYGPEKIFDRAAQFVEEHRTLQGSEKVLASLADMKHRGIVSEDRGPALARVAVQLWPHRADAVGNAADAFADFLGGEDLAGLILTWHSRENDDDSSLAKVIEMARPCLDRNGKVAVAQRILQEPPMSADDDRDWALALWLSSVGDDKPYVTAELLESADLNDSQRHRVLLRAVDCRRELGFDFFLSAVPRLLAMANGGVTRSALLDSSGDISELASGVDERSELARGLVNVLPRTGGDDQVTIARWIRELGGQSTLEAASKILEELEFSSVELLAGEFPESRALKKRLKNLQRDKGIN